MKLLPIETSIDEVATKMQVGRGRLLRELLVECVRDATIAVVRLVVDLMVRCGASQASIAFNADD